MPEEFYSEEEYRIARKRVKAKKGFYWHLATYCIIIGFLFSINMITNPFDMWFRFPALAWGISILFHYLAVFGIPGLNFNDKSWEEQEIKKELNKRAPLSKNPTIPDDELELREFKKLRDEWKDSDFV